MIDNIKTASFWLLLLGFLSVVGWYIVIPLGLSAATQAQELEDQRTAFQQYCWQRGGVVVEQEHYGGVGIVLVCRANTGVTVPFTTWVEEQVFTGLSPAQ